MTAVHLEKLQVEDESRAGRYDVLLPALTAVPGLPPSLLAVPEVRGDSQTQPVPPAPAQQTLLQPLDHEAPADDEADGISRPGRVKLLPSGGQLAGVVDLQQVPRHGAVPAVDGGGQDLYPQAGGGHDVLGRSEQLHPGQGRQRSKVREEQQRGPELREGVDSQPQEGGHKYLMVTYC